MAANSETTKSLGDEMADAIQNYFITYGNRDKELGWVKRVYAAQLRCNRATRNWRKNA